MPESRPASRPTLESDMAEGNAFPFAEATYRRRITIRPGPGRVEAEMEDYVHHFAVVIDHVDGVVTAASAEGVRHPWDACPGGARGIRRLVGERLVDAEDRRGWSEDRLAQCVHVVDLVKLACRHADDDAGIEFVIVVPEPSLYRRTATLWRDGEEAMAWSLKGNEVVGPDRFAGLSISGAEFFGWIDENLAEPDEVEAATVLRRAVHISTSRGIDLDRYAVAADGGLPNDSCFVFRSEVAVTAKRMVGTTRPTERDL